MFGAGLGHLVLGVRELAGAGVGQDEASGQARVEDHDKQNIEIRVVALGTGHLAAQEGVRHDPHAPVGSEASVQATGVAPVLQLQQQAVQEGSQPLALAAVHGCLGVTGRLQDPSDLSPWTSVSNEQGEGTQLSRGLGYTVAGGACC